jgi:Fibronectin type III domain
MGSKITARGRLIAAIVSVSAACAAMPGLASAETVPLPSGAAAASAANHALLSTTCPAAGDCVAVGWYVDTSGNHQGLIETESNGTWSAQQANLSGLPSVQSNPAVYIDAVACTSTGNCVATGNYSDSSGKQQGLIETESNGSWSASELDTSQLPSLKSSSPGITLGSISCPSAGSCVAVGYYYDSSSDEQGLIATQGSGGWSGHEANLSALSPFSSPGINLDDVACVSAGNCAAVGQYRDAGNHYQGLLETDVNGTWTAGEVNLSHEPSVATSGSADLQSVSCPAAGACTAVGYYQDSTDTYQPLVMSQSGGVWQPAGEATIPANAAGETVSQLDLYVNSVSCASAGNCTAVGTYDATSANDIEGLELTESNGSWATGVETVLPGAVGSNPYVWLASVACASAQHCVAAGAYVGSDGNNQALIAQQSGSTWTTAGAEQPTTYYRYDNNGASVACTASGYCAAAGYTLSGASPDNYASFLFAAPNAVTAAAATVIGTSAQVTWEPSSDNGGTSISGYTVTATDATDASRGGQTMSVGTSGGATFAGLTAGDSYTFTISATSLLGTGIPVTTASVMVPFSKQQLLASLSGLLAPKGKPSHLKQLRKTHGYTFTFKPLESGKASVRWNHITGRGKHKRERLVGSGSVTTSGNAAVKVHVKLTALGRRLVKSSHKLRLTATVLFGSGTTSVTETHTFTLR